MWSREAVRGFFTTGLAARGALVWHTAHLDRLEEHAAHFGIPFDRVYLENRMREMLDGKHGFLRCRIVYSFETGEWRIETAPFSPSLLPFRCRVVEIDHPFGRWKTIPRRSFGLSTNEEVILVEKGSGRVLEGSYTNVFLFRGETVLTPPADGSILPGVCRARFMLFLSASGYKVIEKTFRVTDLNNGKLFLTNALRGVIPALLER